MTTLAPVAPHRGTITSLPAIVAADAQREPDRTVFTALDRFGDVVATHTIGSLDQAARRLAADLRKVAAPGDRVLLPAMTGLRFQVAFLACLYTRLVAVPVPPLRAAGFRRESANARLQRLVGICQDCTPVAAVVPGDRIDELAATLAADDTLGRLQLVAAEPAAEPSADATSGGPLVAPEPTAAGDLAFLQYTSGSTASPRGVMITHGALVANQATLQVHMDIRPDTAIVSWLPLYHDMGLCLGLLLPLYTGGRAVLLEPETFLVRPELWLRAVSEAGDAMSASPDFGYAWCARRVKEKAKAGLDLSRWRVTVNGAEPVRASTLRAFHDAFAGCGFDERAMTPAYGLAEATLFVTGGTGHTAPLVRRYDRAALGRGHAEPATDPSGAVELVSCGRPGPGVRVAVVDPESRQLCPHRTVGEIWVRSASNGVGYWRRPDDSRETFGAVVPGTDDTSWLRTGDLGFLDDGELFVVGRRKDLLIVHGANYYPQDFEQLVQQSHPLFAGEVAAACAPEDDGRVAVLVEAAERTPADELRDAAAAAVRAVTAELPVTTDVVVVPRGSLPRTTSGKVRRHACATGLVEGRFSILVQWPRAATEAPTAHFGEDRS